MYMLVRRQYIDLSESAVSHELAMHYDDLTGTYERRIDSRLRRVEPLAIGNDG